MEPVGVALRPAAAAGHSVHGGGQALTLGHDVLHRRREDPHVPTTAVGDPIAFTPFADLFAEPLESGPAKSRSDPA